MVEQSNIDALRTAAIPAPKHLIDGQLVDSSDGGVLANSSPIDGTALGSLAKGTAVDVDRAVASARTAFEDGRWSGLAPAARKKVLHKVADLIEQHMLELAVLGVRDNGTEISMALRAEPGSAAATFRYYAETCDKVNGDIAPTPPGTLGLIHREPVGVVGAIVPWNFPLMIGAWKLAPALAMGNSVVLKPAEVASLSLLRLVELCHEAGLPDGVLNVVTGEGAVVGEALALHRDVDVMLFTGSGGVGRRLLEYSARSNLKRVYLELGGKSANVVFDDFSNLAKAAKVSAGGIFRDSGQVCVAGSRLLVQRSIYEPFLEALKAEAEGMVVGDPLDLRTTAGAIASETQCRSILTKIDRARSEGARLLTGGERILSETGGTYIAPTIFAEVDPRSDLAQEEVFGPVVGVTPFDDEAEAIALANSTVYGLAAGVWTDNLSRAHRMVRALKAGVVHVNTYGGPDVTVPLTGHGQSGNGSDKSLHALEKVTKLKTAWMALD
ncbi:MAG: aldehyde dehydrogenase [Alphaproteobacteria bacterium]